MDIRTIQNAQVFNEVQGHGSTSVPFPRNRAHTDSYGRNSARFALKAPSIDIPNPVSFDEHFTTLNIEQRKIATFLKQWPLKQWPLKQWPLKPWTRRHLLLVSGPPGSGKTHAVFQTLKHLNGHFLKLAYTNEIARFIGGQTIHSALRINYESTKPHSISDIQERMQGLESKLSIPDYVAECHKAADEMITFVFPSLPSIPSAVIIDEVGLIPVWLTLALIKYYGETLFIMLGDEFQLKPVKCRYNIFSFSMEDFIDTTMIKLNLNNRFTPEYHALIDQMKIHVQENDYEGMIQFLKTNFPVAERLVESDYPKISLILAYTNASVKELNLKFINRLDGPIVKIPEIQDGKKLLYGPLQLKPNCKVVVTKDTLAATRGSIQYFSAYVSESDYIELMSGAKIARNQINSKFPIAPAYCFTVHCYQGKTISQPGVVFQFDGNYARDLSLYYTALSRVRDKKQIYAIIL